MKIGPIIHVVPCINWKIYRSLKINIDKNRRRILCDGASLFWFSTKKKNKKIEKEKLSTPIMEQRKVSREQRIRRCVFLILAYVVRANLLRQAIRDFLIKITETTQRTIWEQEGVVYLYIRTRIGRVIDIISQIIKSHELTSPGTSDYRRYWWPSM